MIRRRQGLTFGQIVLLVFAVAMTIEFLAHGGPAFVASNLSTAADQLTAPRVVRALEQFESAGRP